MTWRDDHAQLVLNTVLDHGTPLQAAAAAQRARRAAPLEAARGALLAAEWLRESGLPWADLRPAITAGVPLLVGALGPVLVHPPSLPGAQGWSRPAWHQPQDQADPEAGWSWLRTRHALEIAARLMPSVVRAELHPGLLGRGGCLLTWSPGPDPDGPGSLASMLRALHAQGER